MSTFQPQIFQFFESLPSVPLLEISKHLEPIDIVALSALSLDFFQVLTPKEYKRARISLFVNQYEANVKVVLRSEKRYITHEIDENDPDFFSNLIEIPQKLARKFQCKLEKLELNNAPWLTGKDLALLDFWSARIDNCTFTFTEKDCNVFFKNWMNGSNRNLNEIEFQVGKHFKMDQVLKDLNVEDWDEKKRDGCYAKLDNECRVVECIDFSGGYDISTSDNTLGTILLTEHYLLFHIWRDPFGATRLEKFLARSLKKVNSYANDMTLSWQKRNMWTKKTAEYLESLRTLKQDPELEGRDFL